MALPGPATQIACGDNHTVVLLGSGEVYTFGKHQEGQLGRQKGEEGDESWHMVPQPVPMLGDGCKSTWVGARGNQTFISVDESLVSDSDLSRCRVFSNTQSLGKHFHSKTAIPILPFQCWIWNASVLVVTCRLGTSFKGRHSQTKHHYDRQAGEPGKKVSDFDSPVGHMTIT